MLIGEYYQNLDAKGRVNIPAKFRDDLGDTFVISKGPESCLRIYSATEWEMFQSELQRMRGTEARKLQRFFFSGASECELDTQGRVVVPPAFREYAGLSKELVVVGVANRAEIWDRVRWEEYMNEDSFTPDEIAKAMESLGM